MLEIANRDNITLVFDRAGSVGFFVSINHFHEFALLFHPLSSHSQLHAIFVLDLRLNLTNEHFASSTAELELQMSP